MFFDGWVFSFRLQLLITYIVLFYSTLFFDSSCNPERKSFTGILFHGRLVYFYLRRSFKALVNMHD